jgi:hypothetical protein
MESRCGVFRHRSWYQQSVYDLLTQFKASLVLQDMPASATPLLFQDNESAHFVNITFSFFTIKAFGFVDNLSAVFFTKIKQQIAQ